MLTHNLMYMYLIQLRKRTYFLSNTKNMSNSLNNQGQEVNIHKQEVDKVIKAIKVDNKIN